MSCLRGLSDARIPLPNLRDEAGRGTDGHREDIPAAFIQEVVTATTWSTGTENKPCSVSVSGAVADELYPAPVTKDYSFAYWKLIDYKSKLVCIVADCFPTV